MNLKLRGVTLSFAAALPLFGVAAAFDAERPLKDGSLNLYQPKVDDPIVYSRSAKSVSRPLSALLDDRGVSLKSMGAVGDGVADDTLKIQAWLNVCRVSNMRCEAPAGTYRFTQPLNFGGRIGINIRGAGAGRRPIAGDTAGTLFLADLPANTMAAIDLSGSSYGVVQGFSVDYQGNQPKVMILLARGPNSGGGDGTQYGSDLTFRDLNWRSGSVAGFAGQMAEVLTFDNCRGLARGVPALILSTDLGGRWGVHSPFGFPYMTDVKTQTVFRFFGGEFAGDNSSLIIFDAPGTLSDGVTLSGTYFATSGANSRAVEFRGAWENVNIHGVRNEYNGIQHNRSTVYLGSADLRNSSIQVKAAASDGAAPLAIGGTGSVFGSQVITPDRISVSGSIINSVVTTSNPANVSAGGDLIGRLNAPGISTLSAGGKLAIDDGQGGILVYRQQLTAGSTTWTAVAGGLYQAGFAGDSMLVSFQNAGGSLKATQFGYHDQRALSGNAGVGKLSLSHSGITATFQGTGGWYTVRRLSLQQAY